MTVVGWTILSELGAFRRHWLLAIAGAVKSKTVISRLHRACDWLGEIPRVLKALWELGINFASIDAPGA